MICLAAILLAHPLAPTTTRTNINFHVNNQIPCISLRRKIISGNAFGIKSGISDGNCHVYFAVEIESAIVEAFRFFCASLAKYAKEYCQQETEQNAGDNGKIETEISAA